MKRYPLEQLVEVKKNRLNQAIKILAEKKRILEQEEKKLSEAEQEKQTVLDHKQAKLLQLREALDKGESSDKIQQMKSYLKVVNENLKEKEKKVVLQQAQVNNAKQQVEVATTELLRRKKDVEKLDLHQLEWEKEAKKWLEHQESLDQDEQGTSLYNIKKQEEKRQ